MKKEHIQLAQRILNQHGASLAVDGIFGPLSVRAASAHIGTPRPRGNMTPQRWIAAVIQREANAGNVVPHPVAEDAHWGPVTRDAAYRLLGQSYARPDERAAADTPAPAVRCWTPSDARMAAFYGQPGTGQIVAPLPYPMVLDWDTGTTVTRASMHRRAAANITGALEAIRDAYGLDRIRALNLHRFGGILNVRRKRGGSTWSTHAWGAAIDLWPSGNQLAWKRDRANFARPDYRDALRAFRDAGMMSLGECYDFDWQHFQLNPS